MSPVIGSYNFEAEREKRRKAQEEQHQQNKLEQARIIAALKKHVTADEPVTWKPGRTGFDPSFIATSAGGTVNVLLDDEHRYSPESVSRTGRFSVVIEPAMGSYSRSSAAKTRFRARKDGWTDERVREIAAKITLGLACSAEAYKHIAAAEAKATAATARIKNEGLYEEKPCRVFVRHDTGAYGVAYTLDLPSLDLDEAIAVAKFVNELVRHP